MYLIVQGQDNRDYLFTSIGNDYYKCEPYDPLKKSTRGSYQPRYVPLTSVKCDPHDRDFHIIIPRVPGDGSKDCKFTLITDGSFNGHGIFKCSRIDAVVKARSLFLDQFHIGVTSSQFFRNIDKTKYQEPDIHVQEQEGKSSRTTSAVDVRSVASNRGNIPTGSQIAQTSRVTNAAVDVGSVSPLAETSMPMS
ncbi:hypothetical protein CONLIGDRAFT_680629 [Coniochaeta ligniaria NRRL 30616]|uniref:Uncharacterized protein n=1 Tax=Coniochaeta ligniaria NRRL 30616 TaxID=1408157 RepID=A0A1J7IR51_9PEZI|nr:hypothetical protein CONLIGDRAFT_680629 [Coniochaeta ligniaria NRRL 30616]